VFEIRGYEDGEITENLALLVALLRLVTELWFVHGFSLDVSARDFDEILMRNGCSGRVPGRHQAARFDLSKVAHSTLYLVVGDGDEYEETVKNRSSLASFDCVDGSGLNAGVCDIN